MTRTAYLQYLLATLQGDMASPLGVQSLGAIPATIALKKGTYVWRILPALHNAISYRVRMNHGAAGAAGSFKLVTFDDRSTPGVPDRRKESALLQRPSGQTSDFTFNAYEDSIFVGIEVPNDNTPVPLVTMPPAGFRGLDPRWLTGPVAAAGAQLRPGTVGDLGGALPTAAVDVGERYPGLLIEPNILAATGLTPFYHVDFATLTENPMELSAFCADLLQHYLSSYPGGTIAFQRRPQWQQQNPQGTEFQYLTSLIQRLTQQPLNEPDPPTLPARLSRRYRTDFVAPQDVTGSGVLFAVTLLQRDLSGRRVPFQTWQEWRNDQQRTMFPENFVSLVVPLQREATSRAEEPEALRLEVAATRQRLPVQPAIRAAVDPVLAVLERGFGLDRFPAEILTALARQELGQAASLLTRFEAELAFLLESNRAFGSRMTASTWAQSLASEDAGMRPQPPLREQLPDYVRKLARQNRGLTLANIAGVLQLGQPADVPTPVPMYSRRVARAGTEIRALQDDVRFVADAPAVLGLLAELEEQGWNYSRLSAATKVVLRRTVHDLWNLVPHYLHLQLPLLWAELHRASGRHDQARYFLEVVLDDDEVTAAAMVRYPFLNPVIERPAIALRMARLYREQAEMLLRSMDDELRVKAEARFTGAVRLLERAVAPDNPLARMEVAACVAGLHKIERRLNVFGFAESHVPLFRYQPLVGLAADLAQQAIDAGRQLVAFWQQAEQAARGEIEAAQVVAVAQGLAEAETLRAREAGQQVTLATVQVQQTTQQIADVDAKITELSDPVFHDAAIATGIVGAAGGLVTGAAVGGAIGALAGGGPGGAIVGAGLGLAVGPGMGAAQGLAQWKAHESALNDQRRAKALLEQFGTAIAATQLELARTQKLIADRMAEVAQLRASQTQELAALLREQAFNAERFYQLAAQMRDIYRTLLSHAMRAAFLAEQALEFELGERVNVIGYDYDLPGEEFLLGAERLRADLAVLRSQRVQRFASKRQPASIAVSLAEEFPLALFELRTSGRTTIRIDLGLLERLYPGAHQARISRIELALFALTPPVGVHGTLKSSGLSFVKSESGTAVALMVPPETQLVSRFQYRDGALYFALPEEQLHPFEGMGVATDLTLELPAVANVLERRTIADVHVILHFTALYSATLEQRVVAQRPATAVAMRSFALHEAFSDAFFDLVNSGTAAITLAARHLPSSHNTPIIRRLMLVSLLREGSTAARLEWRIVHQPPGGASRQIDVAVDLRNPTVDRTANAPSLAGASAFGLWRFTAVVRDAAGTAMNLAEELEDVFWFIEYNHSL
jgi:hypothetical protein